MTFAIQELTQPKSLEKFAIPSEPQKKNICVYLLVRSWRVAEVYSWAAMSENQRVRPAYYWGKIELIFLWFSLYAGSQVGDHPKSVLTKDCSNPWHNIYHGFLHGALFNWYTFSLLIIAMILSLLLLHHVPIVKLLIDLYCPGIRMQSAILHFLQ